MYDADALEAINFEQLATATDRLLVLGLASRTRRSAPRLEIPVQTAELTLYMRAATPWRRFTTAALVTAVLSVVAAITALL